jgi:triosephosphate isomerase (TIM)
MRKQFVAGNWKMYKTVPEAVSLAKELAAALGKDPGRRVMVAPAFTALSAVRDALKGSVVMLGAQNCSREMEGAHTGEISLKMLRDVGVSVVILGHSERRHVYGESDSLVNKKVLLALKEGFEVILCVGETLDERQSGITEKVVGEQVRSGLKEVSAADMARVTIAYEPVWAIGTGKNATPQDADAVHGYVRSQIAQLYGSGVSEATVIQYGGSVKPENAAELLKMKHIDGALVGGASLKAESFLAIVRAGK